VLPLGVALPFNTKALTVIPRVDTFLIALVSTSAAGFFAIGDRILGPAAIILVASCALYPFFVRETHTSRTPWLIASGFFGAGAAIAAVASLLAPTLVPVIFGAAYEDAVDVVQLADDPPVDDPPGTLGMRRSENWHGAPPPVRRTPGWLVGGIMPGRREGR